MRERKTEHYSWVQHLTLDSPNTHQFFHVNTRLHKKSYPALLSLVKRWTTLKYIWKAVKIRFLVQTNKEVCILYCNRHWERMILILTRNHLVRPDLKFGSAISFIEKKDGCLSISKHCKISDFLGFKEFILTPIF